jgi:hypothetical protein
MKSKEPKKPRQIESFRKTARDLGAHESEERFDAALKSIAQQKPKTEPRQKPKS